VSGANSERLSGFYALTPERILDAVEVDGRRCTGRFIILNSYENRVYQLELDDDSYVVGKFYRPARWSDDAILDEHDFLIDLEEAEIPVAAPLELGDGETLSQVEGIRYALFPRIGGRAPTEMTDDQLRQLGRLLARIHGVGRSEIAEFRPQMTPTAWLIDNLKILRAGDHIPGATAVRYADVVRRIHDLAAPAFEGVPLQRIHGDCHLGNLLWSPGGLVFLDFDDLVMGPPVQDFWMMQGGQDAWAERRLQLMLEGYETMADFNRGSLRLVESLRAMRMVHFATWIARRWQDPAFPVAFPHFGTASWWEGEVRDLMEQLGRVQESLLGY
jgi:Ser/Thr protein kinase RdoA (MazF antagonist)